MIHGFGWSFAWLVLSIPLAYFFLAAVLAPRFVRVEVLTLPAFLEKRYGSRAVRGVSSVLVLVGYALPGFIMAIILFVWPAARWDWFPLGGFVSDEFEDLLFLEQVWDVFHHSVLPIIAYMIGSLATIGVESIEDLFDDGIAPLNRLFSFPLWFRCQDNFRCSRFHDPQRCWRLALVNAHHNLFPDLGRQPTASHSC